MRNILITLLALCVATPVLANDGPCSEQLPPASYVAMPAPAYTLIRYASQEEMVDACHGGRWDRLFACAIRGDATIHMMSDNYIAQKAGDYHKGKRWVACLITHEVAHLNGWRHD